MPIPLRVSKAGHPWYIWVADYRTRAAVEKAVKAWDEAVDFARKNINSAIPYRQQRRVIALAETFARGSEDDPEAMRARDRRPLVAL